MSNKKENYVHYRTLSKSKHLASDDLIGLDSLPVTIKRSYLGKDLNNRIKEQVAIIEFEEKATPDGSPLKSMILNMTNMHNLSKIAGSPNIFDWVGVRIEIYVQSGIRLGNETVNGLRIRRAKPAPKKQGITPEGFERMLSAIEQGSYSKKSALDGYSLSPEQIERVNAVMIGGQNAS